MYMSFLILIPQLSLVEIEIAKPHSLAFIARPSTCTTSMTPMPKQWLQSEARHVCTNILQHVSVCQRHSRSSLIEE